MQLAELEAQTSKEEMREKIFALESEMKKDTVNIIHIEPKHYFANGLYAREIAIPKGVLLTGLIHKTEHLCVLSKGKVSVYTDEGMQTLESSTVVHSTAGMKRVLFAHEDSIWINFHHNPTNETDLEKIEQLYVVDSFEKLELFQSESLRNKYINSSRSFQDVLDCLGVTAEQAQEISENKEDQIEYSHDVDGVEVLDSSIHGKGVFAKKAFLKGEKISLARIGNLRTAVGRYCNHSSQANAEMTMNTNGYVALICSSDILSGDEILTDYYFNYENSRPTSLDKKRGS